MSDEGRYGLIPYDLEPSAPVLPPEMLRDVILGAFGIKHEYDIGTVPVPWRVRFWRRLTFAYRRGKAVDWRSYNAAETEARRRDEAYRAALPGRMQEIADQLSEGLPDGMRFEWTEREP